MRIKNIYYFNAYCVLRKNISIVAQKSRGYIAPNLSVVSHTFVFFLNTKMSPRTFLLKLIKLQANILRMLLNLTRISISWCATGRIVNLHDRRMGTSSRYIRPGWRCASMYRTSYTSPEYIATSSEAEELARRTQPWIPIVEGDSDSEYSSDLERKFDLEGDFDAEDYSDAIPGDNIALESSNGGDSITLSPDSITLSDNCITLKVDNYVENSTDAKRRIDAKEKRTRGTESGINIEGSINPEECRSIKSGITAEDLLLQQGEESKRENPLRNGDKRGSFKETLITGKDNVDGESREKTDGNLNKYLSKIVTAISNAYNRTSSWQKEPINSQIISSAPDIAKKDINLQPTSDNSLSLSLWRKEATLLQVKPSPTVTTRQDLKKDTSEINQSSTWPSRTEEEALLLEVKPSSRFTTKELRQDISEITCSSVCSFTTNETKQWKQTSPFVMSSDRKVVEWEASKRDKGQCKNLSMPLESTTSQEVLSRATKGGNPTKLEDLKGGASQKDCYPLVSDSLPAWGSSSWAQGDLVNTSSWPAVSKSNSSTWLNTWRTSSCPKDKVSVRFRRDIASYLLLIRAKLVAAAVSVCFIGVSWSGCTMTHVFVYFPFRLVFGTLYPAYASYKAVRTKNVKEYVSHFLFLIFFYVIPCWTS